LKPDHNKLRVRAVSYLNTVPLVWGMLHGCEREQVDLSFSIPSDCARDVQEGGAEVGLVPVAEVARQGLEIAPGVGIACYGAVRSILLCARVPWPQVKTLAADASSRTSVELARVILRERYGVEPSIRSEPPHLDEMLSHADCALIIGDPALQVDPLRTGYQYLDLGAEWLALTGLPFVFAAWAGKPGVDLDCISRITTASYGFGRDRIDNIVEAEHERRGVSRELARRYLTQNIHFEIGPEERRGLETFLELADLRTPALTAHT
jgi:chorismate dehydratase